MSAPDVLPRGESEASTQVWIMRDWLPPYLKALVKLCKVRPDEVAVHMTTGLATAKENWRTAGRVSFGKELDTRSEMKLSSDGDSDPVTSTTFNAPVAVFGRQLGRGTRSFIRISIGHVPQHIIDTYKFRDCISTENLSMALEIPLSLVSGTP